MFNYLPEIKKVLNSIYKETDELQKLNLKVNEFICDEIIKQSCLYKFHKEVSSRYFIYELKKDDYEHITEYLHLIQTIILPDLVIMAQTDDKDSYRILFRKGQI